MRSTRPAGLHHAMPDRASGFCVYDDPAVGIAWLLAQGAERVAYVDVDVHHGDGVQTMLLERPAGAHGLDPRVRARVRLLPGHRAGWTSAADPMPRAPP